ncbi:MAG: glutaminyl-peptide cyclotransferase, partial [Anaerolineae bacterium]|nr:glutaminyl-peptide cyclotransferase [Anaerolineae bacterium]
LIVYDGQGWGLCYDGTDIYMTDGSSTLFRRAADTFDVEEAIPVTMNGEPVQSLNELECVGDSIYANIYLTDNIVRIDKDSGNVTAQINAAGLLTAEETAQLGHMDTALSALVFDSNNRQFVVDPVNEGGFVLNGIAYNEETDTFLITGKQWPKMFEVRFIPAEE